MKESFQIADLIVKEIKGDLSPQEKVELDNWVNKSKDNLTIYTNAIDQKQQLTKLESYTSFKKEEAWNNIQNELFEPKVISLFSKKILKYAAAITIPIMLFSGMAYFFFNKESNVTLATLDERIKPGVQQATLVLSNGESHLLSDPKSNIEFKETDAQISNSNNTLSYITTEEKHDSYKPAIYNDLITPRGGGYQLELADGTTVWLNADSKLSFPVSFSDSTRQVFLEGEGYFEVAHNGSPFIVTTGDMDIRVMGTSFNISAYKEDLTKKTTLVEGKVRVELNKDGQLVQEYLSPNKQATIYSNGSAIVVADVDASQYKSWVNGKFEFNNETLDHVLKKLARWYDFEYKFSNTNAKDFHFSGRLDNQEKISSILKMLEMTTNVTFKVEDNLVIVK